MSLEQRARQVHGTTNRNTAVMEEARLTPIQLAPREYFAIVDGELVNVIGTTDVPGMSPAYWCADSNGTSAPVSVLEAKIFTTAQQALQFLQQGQGSGQGRQKSRLE